jgi:tRNA1(Val) A37 N6-methylase TrmN6
VICSCCDFENAADRQFTPQKAATELQSYRQGRVGPTTRILRDLVVDAGLNQGALLDIGGGVGALAFELLSRGMSSALVLDASAAYVAAASQEAERQGGRAQVLQGDFVRIAPAVPPADLVSLDRVVCCYPSYEPLLDQALRHAQRGVALSYPRGRWYVRAAVWFDNAKRARGSGFRMFVHPPRRIQSAIESAGFVLRRRRFTIMWTIEVYQRAHSLGTRSRTHRGVPIKCVRPTGMP